MAKLLEPIAERRGEAPALLDEFGETSWSAFDERVNRLVHALRDAGLRSGDTFAVLSGNRREYYELMAAANHGGWRYVPVNWHWVPEEIAYVLDNSDSRALLTDVRFADVARETLARDDCPEQALRAVIGAEGADGLVGYEELLAAGSAGSPADPVLGGPMFYTSGTTGRPKGVASSLFGSARRSTSCG